MAATPATFLIEAQAELRAAQQNLKEARTGWDNSVANLQTSTNVLAAAQQRVDKANALVSSAIAAL